MQARILRGLIAHSAFSLIELNQISSRNFYARADAIAIRLRSDKQDFEPMIGVP